MSTAQAPDGDMSATQFAADTEDVTLQELLEELQVAGEGILKIDADTPDWKDTLPAMQYLGRVLLEQVPILVVKVAAMMDALDARMAADTADIPKVEEGDSGDSEDVQSLEAEILTLKAELIKSEERRLEEMREVLQLLSRQLSADMDKSVKTETVQTEL